jgi:hypothetical protein
MNKNRQWAVKPMVPEEIYTDRQEFLDYLYQAALDAIGRRTMSTVLLGQRRMGKTEIFKRVINRLFFEQDHTDPQAVVPVFFTFPDEVISRENFALKYVENFVRWYVAFRLRKLEILSTPRKPHELAEYIRPLKDISDGFKKRALSLLTAIEEGGVNLPEEKALYLPREISDWDDSTIVMFLDEFQNTYLPEYHFRVVGFMQEAVESPTCPHFVTGSAMSILTEEILGKGALYGRFMSEPITAFTDYWGKELALRVARYYRVELPEVIAPVVSERCGGNPYYITAVIQQAAKQEKTLHSEEILNEILAIDLSSGFIWAELREQVMRWIQKTNEYGITKWILYLSALETEERINLERIKEELYRQEKLDVPIETIHKVLIKLSRGDLIDYKPFGEWFAQVNDPILQEFLRVWGKIEVVGANAERIRDETSKKFQALQRRFNDYKGYLAEVYLIQVLWNSQRKKLSGRYFHSYEDIQMPHRFFYISQRSKFGESQGLEVDIYAAAGKEIWLTESKWWQGRKVGKKVVGNLLEQAAEVRRREGEYLRTLRLWIFAHDGVTKEAERLMRKHHILWSSRVELDALLEEVNLRKLPVIEDEPLK